MKVKFVIFETKVPDWAETARHEYAEKLSAFFPFELQLLKSPSGDRSQAESKRRREAELLLKTLDPRDQLILFDEGGKLARSSEDFAKSLERVITSGKPRAVFAIGGPYGFDESVIARSQARWSLSPLTMNHWIASLAALEQLYRGCAILKGLPYHNR